MKQRRSPIGSRLLAWWIAALAAVTQAVPAASHPGRPSILVILADDLGFSDVGCYGGEIPTPHLEALAREGLRFSQFYNTARCWPTRAALLTGYYAQQVRRDKVPGIASGGAGTRPPWAPLLPTFLRPLGYRSYHSGKWHIDGQPLQGGFDRSYSLEDHDRNFAPRQHRLDDAPLPPVDPRSGSFFASTAIADHAIQCLRDHARERADQPFFSFVAFTAPHFPLQAPHADIERFREAYRDGWDAARQRRWARLGQLGLGSSGLAPVEPEVGPPYAFPDALEALGPNEVNRPLPWHELTQAQQAFQAGKMAVHAAMVHRMDTEIGRILDQVRAMGALENTLVLFLSDNGASAEIMVRGDGHDPNAPPGSAATFLCLGPGWSTVANTPFRRHKTWVHEGGIATPLIVHWPAGIRDRGAWRHTPGHVIDVVPTVLQAVGIEADQTPRAPQAPPSPGRSLLGTFAADGAPVHDVLWWLHEGNRALRAGSWKIVASGEHAPWELYDLSRDRAESTNLAGARPEVVRELAARWDRLNQEHATQARGEGTAPGTSPPAAGTATGGQSRQGGPSPAP